MIRVADYVAKSIADYGIRQVFMVTIGGAMFPNDAFGSEPRIQYVFNHIEGLGVANLYLALTLVFELRS
jgi:acetolactate synthase-1/2/3 large subunit